MLEPRQARGFSDKKKQNLRAVYATPIVEIALIEATMVANPGSSLGWKLDPDPCDPETPEDAELNFDVQGDVQQTTGFLYLLDRTDFEEVYPLTFAAFRPVIPVAVIAVSPDYYSLFPGIRLRKEVIS